MQPAVNLIYKLKVSCVIGKESPISASISLVKKYVQWTTTMDISMEDMEPLHLSIEINSIEENEQHAGTIQGSVKDVDESMRRSATNIYPMGRRCAAAVYDSRFVVEILRYTRNIL
ncbi:hypothetical protein AgCh_024808 [Apium graveolens]